MIRYEGGYCWDEFKNAWLKAVRGTSFQEIVEYPIVEFVRHPSRHQQGIILFNRCGYVWATPYVEGKDGLFLKTTYPSRKWTKRYRGRLHEEDQLEED